MRDWLSEIVYWGLVALTALQVILVPPSKVRESLGINIPPPTEEVTDEA